MVDRLEPPPRMSGIPAADVSVLRDYVWQMWQNLILEKGVTQTVDQPDEAVDPETGIITAFPVGYVFQTTRAEDPATYLGYGTWERIGKGCVFVHIDEDDADFDTVRKLSGAKTVVPTGTVDAPIFTGDPLGTHDHDEGSLAADSHNLTVQGVTAGADFDAVTAVGDHSITGTTGATSAGTPAGTNSAPAFTGAAQSTLQPAYATYFWERTA